MELIAIILLIFFAVIVYLLIAPIDFSIDTRKGEYYIELSHAAKITLFFENINPMLQVKILFYSKKIDIIESSLEPGKKKLKKKQKPKKQKKTKTRIVKVRRLIARVFNFLNKWFKAFKIKKMIISIDTNDYIKNAYLIPIFTMINMYGTNISYSVNYVNQNYIILLIRTRLYKLLSVIIVFVLKVFFIHLKKESSNGKH